MKITDIRCTPVFVPMIAPLRWSGGVEPGTTRTIIELITDEGIVGLGETYGGIETVRVIEESRPFFIGMDPFEVNRFVKKMDVFRVTSEAMAHSAAMKFVGAGVEMAMWDIIGKALNKRCCDLWGGADTELVPFAAYLFYRDKNDSGGGGEATPEAIVDQCEELFETHGFTGAKLKNGVYPPDEELAAVRALREHFGDRMKYLRVDPNQAWSVETSINILRKMAEYDLEYCEDPTWNIEGMALVRHDVSVPLATNQCVVSFDQIAAGVRVRAVDIIMADVHFWGGPTNLMRLAKISDTFNIGLSLHSDRELGISTAAQIHIWSALPQISHPADSHYHHQADDIIAESHRYRDGGFPVPTKPGLGVELDPNKLEKYHRFYESLGSRLDFFDPAKPNWVPSLPKW